MADIFTPPTPPAPLPANLGPVTPFLARRGEFVPEVGTGLTVMLEGESVRTVITEVINHDHVVAEITSITTGKAPHGYKKGSTLVCKRSLNDLSEIWQPHDLREMREQEEIERIRQQLVEPEPQAEPEPEPEMAVELVPHGTDEPPRRKVLGPRRSKIAKPAVPAPKRVGGPRRSRIARAG